MRLRIVLALLFLPAAAFAADVRVRLADSSAGRCLAAGAVLTAVADDSTEVRAEPRGAAEPLAIKLDENRQWTLQWRADGCWSAPREWSGGDGADVTIETHAAGEVRGTFVAKVSEKPKKVVGTVRRSSEDRRGAAPDPLECSLDFPSWRCTVPADLPIDMRLEIEGFAPAHVWNVVSAPGKAYEVEPQPLVAGASLAGWIEDPEGKAIGSATLTLVPLQTAEARTTRDEMRQESARTNERGFFQLRGVAPGDYRLVARAGEWSPAVIPVVKVRAGEAMTWPRAIRLSPTVTMDLTLDPPLTPDGRRWVVSMSERIPLDPHSTAPVVQKAASREGLWSAAGLRADVHSLMVRDGNEGVVEETTIDLSGGIPAVITLHVGGVEVSGKLLVGDEPLQAELRFTLEGGNKSVRAKADEEGRWATTFPAAGRWLPRVYRAGGSQMRAGAIEVPETKDGPVVRDIVLPGGRLSGEVVTSDGRPAKAVVHVVHEGTLTAQQVTPEDGKFDFVGLSDGEYAISAEADAGTTPRPLTASIQDRETTELRVMLEAWNELHGVVVAPSGLPASGALIRISTDGGISWSDINADVEGKFEYAVGGGVSDLQLLVLPYSYPSAMLRVPMTKEARAPITIALAAQGGRLRVDSDRVYVVRHDMAAPLRMFRLPQQLALGNDVHLEAGSYAICQEPRLSAACKRALVAPGSETVIALQERKETETP